MPETEYPEHERMAAVSDQSQAIGEFLEWLTEQGITLATWERTKPCDGHSGPSMASRWGDTAQIGWKWQCEGGRMVGHPDSNKPGEIGGTCATCGGTGRIDRIEPRLAPGGRRTEGTLADYFGINLRKIEAEKRAMLASLRAAS